MIPEQSLDRDSGKDDLYLIGPWCRDRALNAWTDQELGSWTGHHIVRRDCVK